MVGNINISTNTATLTANSNDVMGLCPYNWCKF